MTKKYVRYDLLPAFIFVGLLIIISIIGCSRKSTGSLYDPKPPVAPPNGYAINDTLYIDKTEIPVIGWREYMFWTGRIFGFESEQFLSTVPDSAIWKTIDIDEPMDKRKLWGKASLENLPIVGITQSQTEAYSLWRTDRVFEYILSNYNILRIDPDKQNAENHFTIKKYLNGEFGSVDKSLVSFYYFRLPTPEERKLILALTDSINLSYFKKCKSIICNNCKLERPYLATGNRDDILRSYERFNWTTAESDCVHKSKAGVHYLRGGVNEWSASKDTCFGQIHPHFDSRENDLDIIPTPGPNKWTGFRNVCVIRQIDKN